VNVLVNARWHSRVIVAEDEAEAKTLAINAAAFNVGGPRVTELSRSVINTSVDAAPYVAPAGKAKTRENWRAADAKRRDLNAALMKQSKPACSRRVRRPPPISRTIFPIEVLDSMDRLTTGPSGRASVFEDFCHAILGHLCRPALHLQHLQSEGQRARCDFAL
jgi:hypothetical protein